MALIRNGTVDQRRLSTLTRRLAAEIDHPTAMAQPTIYENRIAQTQKYNVSVVWDE